MRKRALDDDDVVLTDEEAATLRPGEQVIPPAILDAHKRLRGKQRAPTKVLVSIRIEPDVLAAYRRSGKGWQARMHDAIASHAPKATRVAADPRPPRGARHRS